MGVHLLKSSFAVTSNSSSTSPPCTNSLLPSSSSALLALTPLAMDTVWEVLAWEVTAPQSSPTIECQCGADTEVTDSDMEDSEGTEVTDSDTEDSEDSEDTEDSEDSDTIKQGSPLS